MSRTIAPMTERAPSRDRSDAAPSRSAEAPSLDDGRWRSPRLRAPRLPPPFAERRRPRCVSCVEDWPDDETLDELGIEDAYDLTGLYDGVPLTERSVDRPVPWSPGTVWLFRRPLLDEWADRGDVSLEALVAHVVVHELAHHFGWSDDDIAAIDRWWE